MALDAVRTVCIEDVSTSGVGGAVTNMWMGSSNSLSGACVNGGVAGGVGALGGALGGGVRKEIDIKRFAKVEKIPGGAIEDSCVIDGVMINKDVLHQKMRRYGFGFGFGYGTLVLVCLALVLGA